MQLTHELLDRLEKLEQKYAAMGQDLLSYIEGLLYADYLTYWDYIHLDTLLSLQNTRTPFPDERIFIMYHQITELYFRLCIDAIELLSEGEEVPDPALFKRQLERLDRYFRHLTHSYDIMVDGMDREEFLKFRMSLLPASGFQSAQYRIIEIMSTDFYRLAHARVREKVGPDTPAEQIYEVLYWRSGATELATGKKTLTLRQFEEKYGETFVRLAHKMKARNLWQLYLKLPEEARKDKDIIRLMRAHDLNVNVRWPLMHYRSAVRYLDRKPQAIAATGGTNWQKYLPPRMQLVMFYPDLWSEQERANWGKSAKMKAIQEMA